MWLALAVLLALLLSSPGRGPTARYECAVQPGPPVRVQVYRLEGASRRPVGPELTYRHPGKMASAADVDGDGKLDLLVLVYKTTRYDPRPGWRPFVYTLDGDRWVAKWLGSRVGRPLEEAALVRTPNGMRMLTIERYAEGQTVFTLYHWRGFGFWGEWTGEPGPAMSGLEVEDVNGDSVDEISVAVGDRRVSYAFRDGGYLAADSSEEERE